MSQTATQTQHGCDRSPRQKPFYRAACCQEAAAISGGSEENSPQNLNSFCSEIFSREDCGCCLGPPPISAAIKIKLLKRNCIFAFHHFKLNGASGDRSIRRPWDSCFYGHCSNFIGIHRRRGQKNSDSVGRGHTMRGFYLNVASFTCL